MVVVEPPGDDGGVLLRFHPDLQGLVSYDNQAYNYKYSSSFHVINLMRKDSKIEIGFYSNTLIISKEIGYFIHKFLDTSYLNEKLSIIFQNLFFKINSFNPLLNTRHQLVWYCFCPLCNRV